MSRQAISRLRAVRAEQQWHSAGESQARAACIPPLSSRRACLHAPMRCANALCMLCALCPAAFTLSFILETLVRNKLVSDEVAAKASLV